MSDCDDYPEIKPPTPEELEAMAKWANGKNLQIGVDENGMPTYTHVATLRIDQPRRMFVGKLQ